MAKKLLLTVAVLASLLTPLAAQAQKIGLAMAELDNFLTILKEGVVNAGKKGGASVLLEDAKRSKRTQLNQIQSLIDRKVDAIIVVPVDTDATPTITKMAADAKIPLVYVNRKPADFAQLPANAVFVASNEKVSGTLQTQEVCRLMKGAGDVLVLMGDLSNEAARTRTKDIDEVLATPECSGIKIVEKRIGHWDRALANHITHNVLVAGKTTGRKFDAIIANNDEMALGAISALKSNNMWKPEFIVAGIDATPDALASMKAGELKVTVLQNAVGQGSAAVDAALKLARKQAVERLVDVPFELVTPANLNQYTGRN